MSGLTLDAGALIAFERNDRNTVALLARARAKGERFAVPAGALGQVWRDGRKQARLAKLLGSSAVDVVPMDDGAARGAGQLCGITHTIDVIDASVAVCARQRGHRIVTSDPKDMVRLAPRLTIIAV